MKIALTDLTELPVIPAAREQRARRFIHDARDIPFLKLMALTGVTVAASGIALFWPGVFRWWLASARLVVVFYLMGPFILMLHNTSHRRLFKGRYAALNQLIPWFLGPFFGESPETYFTHHVGMHHPENNVGPDISSTLDYRRDEFVDFMRYFLRFFFGGIVGLTRYFAWKKRRTLLVRTLVGEAAFVTLSAVLLFVDWRATLMVFILPIVITRFVMMAGNWGQHAFVDEASPANSYRNSITCINSGYNRRCFNDGYHIGHHLKQTRHWTELPGEFQQNIARYEAERALVFQGVDFFYVWLLLMGKRYGTLADHLVQLGDVELTKDERIALLQRRTRWTRPAYDRNASTQIPLLSDAAE